MLSIKEAKELIGDPNISDEQVEKIRNSLYELADLAFEAIFNFASYPSFVRVVE